MADGSIPQQGTTIQDMNGMAMIKKRKFETGAIKLMNI